MHVGIVGAGISGRLLAWQLRLQGAKVSLFDKGRIARGDEDNFSAAYTAAGMLTPISEADHAEELIVSVGKRALSLWPGLVESLGHDVDFIQNGSLILAHANDRADLNNFHTHLSRYSGLHTAIKSLSQIELAELEPELSASFDGGTFISGEACLSPQKFMQALSNSLRVCKADLYERVQIEKISPHKIESDGKTWSFDTVVDCRGLGAKPDNDQLRGVRGETVCVFAPDVDLRHVIRLMHPRYQIYIVPRASSVYLIGATQIESDSMAPITVRSALELLSALYSVHKGFAEANILQARVNCRPALPDNLPLIEYGKGLIRVNGLFRHGILLSPAVVEDVVNLLFAKDISDSKIPRKEIFV